MWAGGLAFVGVWHRWKPNSSRASFRHLGREVRWRHARALIGVGAASWKGIDVGGGQGLEEVCVGWASVLQVCMGQPHMCMREPCSGGSHLGAKRKWERSSTAGVALGVERCAVQALVGMQHYLHGGVRGRGRHPRKGVSRGSGILCLVGSQASQGASHLWEPHCGWRHAVGQASFRHRGREVRWRPAGACMGLAT
jgi:hypothetical protein